jgi:hypothetical protein
MHCSNKLSRTQQQETCVELLYSGSGIRSSIALLYFKGRWSVTLCLGIICDWTASTHLPNQDCSQQGCSEHLNGLRWVRAGGAVVNWCGSWTLQLESIEPYQLIAPHLTAPTCAAPRKKKLWDGYPGQYHRLPRTWPSIAFVFSLDCVSPYQQQLICKSAHYLATRIRSVSHGVGG